MAHFQHPTDVVSRQALVQSAARLKPEVLSFIANYQAYLYARLISSCLQVSGEQLPELHVLLMEACEILDVHPPLFFVENESTINAWTSGTEQPFLVITSGMVERLTDTELLAVMGHELGHVKAHHMYFQALAANAQNILAMQAQSAGELEACGHWLISTIGVFQSASVSEAGAKLQNALLEWSRASELYPYWQARPAGAALAG